MNAASITRMTRRRSLRIVAWSACASLILLVIAPATAAGAPPSRLTATELDRILSKAEKSLEKAESAVRKTDPGRVSNLLRRVDEEMARFQTGSRLTELERAFATGRSAAGGGNMEEAGEAVRRARLILPTLSDYMVMRQAEFEGRVALHSAELDDAEGYLVALDRLESAVLPTLLSARITEFREAIARGRDAMVRRDMETGRTEVASARQALDGLHLAGALSRTLFSLRIGSEMMDSRAMIAARDHLNRALRDLRKAVEVASDPLRADLDGARERIEAVWKRLNRPQEGDLDAVLEVTQLIERSRQGLA